MNSERTNAVRKTKQRILSESSSESDGWNDVENDDTAMVVCIFTKKQYRSANDYFTHLKDSENFDIWQLVMTDLNLDFFGYVKLINFLRINYSGKSPPTLAELQNNRSNWEEEENYLKPVIDDDPLLQYMIVDEEEEDSDLEELAIKKFIESADHETSAYDLLEKERKINKNLRENLERATQQIEEMKNFMHNVILSGSGDFTRSVSACRQQKINGSLEEEDLKDEDFEDFGYYSTYSHHEIHAEMIQDHVRTSTYRNAVFSNASYFKDKIILDVGCGTGILSMFCAQVGAAHVYGVDMSDMAYKAIDIVRENHFEDKITIIKSTIEEAILPVDKVDIIISEWMGYFLLYESMFDSVIFARNKWLKDDGVMLPSACSIHLVGAHGSLYQRRVGFWSNVYGFKMPSVQKQAVREGYIINISKDELCTEASKVFMLPTKTAESDDLNFKSTFTLKVLQSTLLSTVVGYFDCYFNDLENNLKFSTSPHEEQTHWKQTVFFLENPIEVKKDDEISCAINCRKNIKDPRSLIVDLKIGLTNQTFNIE